MEKFDASTPRDKDADIESRLQQIIAGQHLAAQRELVQCLAARLNVGVLDCAAALLYLNQPQMHSPFKPVDVRNIEPVRTNYRSVRYRLDVGSQHNVGKEQIQAVLIEESGVDKKRIGRIDIRQHYTLVELPEGMPADIFQILSEATLGERKLAIKRVKPNRRSANKS